MRKFLCCCVYRGTFIKSSIILFFLCLCFILSCQAFDGPLASFITAEELQLQLTQEHRIQIIKEQISVTLLPYNSLYDSQFFTDYDCTLYIENTSNEQSTINAILPSSYETQVRDYRLFVNHQKIPTTIHEEVAVGTTTYPSAAVAQIALAPQTVTVVHYTYSLISRNKTGDRALIFQYLFSTGKHWTQTTQVDIFLHVDDHALPAIFQIIPSGLMMTTKNQLEWHFTGLPDEDIYVEISNNYDIFWGSYMFWAERAEDAELLFRSEALSLKKLSHEEMEALLTEDTLSDDLRKFILFWLSSEYITSNPSKAIIFLKELVLHRNDEENYDTEDYYNIYNLVKCLLSQQQRDEAIPYLYILANQKERPGFSIYAQFILQEYGVMKAPLNLDFPNQQTMWERLKVLEKAEFGMYDDSAAFTIPIWAIFAVLVLFLLSVLYTIWKLVDKIAD